MYFNVTYVKKTKKIDKRYLKFIFVLFFSAMGTNDDAAQFIVGISYGSLAGRQS